MVMNVQQDLAAGLQHGNKASFEDAVSAEVRSMPWQKNVSVGFSNGALSKMMNDSGFADEVLGSLRESAEGSGGLADDLLISVGDDGRLSFGLNSDDPQKIAAKGKSSINSDLMEQMQRRSDRIRKDNAEFSKKRYKKEQKAKAEHEHQYQTKLREDGLRRYDIEMHHRQGRFDDNKKMAKNLNAIASYRNIMRSGRELL